MPSKKTLTRDALCMAVVLAACRAQAAPGESAPKPTVAPQKSETHTNAATRAPEAPRSSAASELLTPLRLELLTSFVTRDLLKLTPEEAVARFAATVPLAKKEPVPEGALLQGTAAGDKLELSYDLTAKGKLYCAVATLRFAVATAEESARLYKQLDVELRKRLGKPKSVTNSDGPRPTLAWKLVKRVELMMGEIPADPSLALGPQVELMIGEPTGETE